MRKVYITTYDRGDVIRRALQITATDTAGFVCDGGPHCPRCRMAEAVTELTAECGLPFDWGDDTLRIAASGLPEMLPWGKVEADEVLRGRLVR
jgi:hypothetical protein